MAGTSRDPQPLNALSQSRRRRWGPAVWAAFGLLVWIAVWWPALFEGKVIYLDDASNYNLPVRMYVGQNLAEGHVPLWGPAILKGVPLAGQQASEWCPDTWLMALPVAHKAELFTILTAILYLVAWCGQGLLGTRLGLAPWAAALAATAYTYCGPLAARHVHTNVLEVMVALPWAVLAADLSAREKGRRAWAAMLLLTAVTAWMTTAFFPEIMLFVGVGLVTFGLASRRWCGGWGKIAAGGALGLVLGMP